MSNLHCDDCWLRPPTPPSVSIRFAHHFRRPPPVARFCVVIAESGRSRRKIVVGVVCVDVRSVRYDTCRTGLGYPQFLPAAGNYAWLRDLRSHTSESDPYWTPRVNARGVEIAFSQRCSTTCVGGQRSASCCRAVVERTQQLECSVGGGVQPLKSRSRNKAAWSQLHRAETKNSSLDKIQILMHSTDLHM